MTKADKAAILNLSNMFLREYARLRRPEGARGNVGACQANYDALNGFKYYGFIQDFDLDKGILMGDVWHEVRGLK